MIDISKGWLGRKTPASLSFWEIPDGSGELAIYTFAARDDPELSLLIRIHGEEIEVWFGIYYGLAAHGGDPFAIWESMQYDSIEEALSASVNAKVLLATFPSVEEAENFARIWLQF